MAESTWSVDVPELVEQCGGLREVLDAVIDTYLEQYPQLLAEVGRAAATRDAAALARSAHKLKGAISIFGVEAVVEPVAGLERAGQAADLSRVDELYARLESEVGRLAGELRRIRQTPAS
jgi:HPt (histidine-containing phosphotransfer) domain-containing protein